MALIRIARPVAAALMLTAAGRADVIQVPGDETTIQAAIDAAADGDEIVVGPGIWAETIDLLGKAITVRSADGPDATILNGAGLGDSVVTCVSGEGGTTRIEGFQVRGGEGWYSSFYDETIGGGMRIAGASPTVVGCRFVNNHATLWGGGIAVESGRPVISDCLFTGNDADGGGSAIHNREDGGHPLVLGCTFIDNQNPSGPVPVNGALTTTGLNQLTVIGCWFEGNRARTGGALNIANTRATVTRCTFVDNRATEPPFANGIPIGGGAIDIFGGDTTISQCVFRENTSVLADGGAIVAWAPFSERPVLVDSCLFVGNSAGDRGGAIMMRGMRGAIRNCTVFANTAPDVGGIHARICVDFEIANSILRGNGVEQVGGDIPPINCPTVIHSNVQGGWTAAGFGNIDVDPQFVSPLLGDFRLQATSPSVDTGLNDHATACRAELDGNQRVAGDPPVVDMGAYELDAPPFEDLNANELLDACEAGGDVNGDGRTSVDDLNLVIVNWGSCPSPPFPCFGDTNLDGMIDTNDLVAVITGWTF